MRNKNSISIIEAIELGLNIIAQDVLWKHTEKDINHYINRFKFYLWEDVT